MNDGQAMANEIQRALAGREQERLQILIGVHGGVDAWHALCCARRAADTDYRLARVIVRALRRGGHGAALRLLTGEQQCIAAEPAILAYWVSVAKSGAEGWHEERDRIRQVERAAATSVNPDDRRLMLDVWAVRSLIPAYRSWGQMLLDAEIANDRAADGH